MARILFRATLVSDRPSLFSVCAPSRIRYIFITEWGWPCGKLPIGLEDFLPVCDAGKGSPIDGAPFLFVSATPPPNNHGDTPPNTQNVPKALSFGTFVHGSF